MGAIDYRRRAELPATNALAVTLLVRNAPGPDNGALPNGYFGENRGECSDLGLIAYFAAVSIYVLGHLDVLGRLNAGAMHSYGFKGVQGFRVLSMTCPPLRAF